MRGKLSRNVPALLLWAMCAILGVTTRPAPAAAHPTRSAAGPAVALSEATGPAAPSMPGVIALGSHKPRGSPLRVHCGWRGSDYAPFHRWPASATRPTGFEPDLIVHLGKLLGRSVTFVDPLATMAKPRIEMLARGRADVVISTFSITKARRKQVEFTRPYFVDGLGVLVAASSRYRKPAELATKRIIVVPGTTGAAWVAAHWPKAKRISSPHADERSALVSGTAQGYLNDRSRLVHLACKDARVRVLADALTREPWGMAVAKSNTKLRLQLDTALAQLRSSGKLAELRRKWLRHQNKGP